MQTQKSSDQLSITDSDREKTAYLKAERLLRM
jgi:hypothetical protein